MLAKVQSRARCQAVLLTEDADVAHYQHQQVKQPTTPASSKLVCINASIQHQSLWPEARPQRPTGFLPLTIECNNLSACYTFMNVQEQHHWRAHNRHTAVLTPADGPQACTASQTTLYCTIQHHIVPACFIAQKNILHATTHGPAA